MWLPEDAEADPVPAILEYIPYRKRDFTRLRDEPMHAYFAGHGYACVRLDIRGSGESEGVLVDEYLEQEQDDAVEAIAWIARQPWCTGAVGMMGKSWGGFNSLQVAARRPPALAAIMPVCATDDRYADDVHFMGGCMLVDNIDWGSVFQAFLPRPPDPAIVGEAWRDMWQDRLDGLVCPLETWFGHQRRDAFWRHGSVCEDYSAIGCAVYAVGGWVDGYSNPILRLMANLDVPRKALIGPWAHLYPHDGAPGPAIGFLQEALRWWDHWLKGVDTGIMDEPRLRIWMAESEPPETQVAERSGRWIAEPAWPSPQTALEEWHLAEGALSVAQAAGGTCVVRPELAVGTVSGDWGAFAFPHELPGDQRPDDALSCVFVSPPLAGRVEILGAPVLRLTVTVDRPVAMLAVRLNDVRPDGTVARVTYGLLNLTHRDGHAAPQALIPGRAYAVEVRLNDTAYAFPAGHRLRVAVSTSYWPVAWPSPEAVSATIHLAPSALVLPVRPLGPDDARLAPFGRPEAAPGPRISNIRAAPPFARRTEWDLVRNTLTRVITGGAAAFGGEGLNRFEDIDLAIEFQTERCYEITLDDPASASAAFDHTITFARDHWRIEIRSRTRLRSTPRDFLLECDVDVYEGETRVSSRRWTPVIPRDLM